MENRCNKKNGRKYSLKVHVVLVTKYRKELLRNSYINNDLKTKIYDICKNNNYQIIAILPFTANIQKNILKWLNSRFFYVNIFYFLYSVIWMFMI